MVPVSIVLTYGTWFQCACVFLIIHQGAYSFDVLWQFSVHWSWGPSWYTYDFILSKLLYKLIASCLKSGEVFCSATGVFAPSSMGEWVWGIGKEMNYLPMQLLGIHFGLVACLTRTLVVSISNCYQVLVTNVFTIEQ